MRIESLNVEGNYAIMFLGVMLDKHITWKDHIRTVESKIAKNIGLLHRARQVLTEASLKTIHFSIIHLYLNYAKITWASTNVTITKLNKINLLQKQSVRIVLNKVFRSKENFANSYKTVITKMQRLKHFSDKYISTCNLYAQI